MSPSFARTPGLRVLVALLAAKFVWDVVIITQAWPDHSRAKLGVAVVVPVLIIGLLKGKHWALNLTGVAAIFWITFLVARLAMPFITVGSEPLPDFPWSNLVALPALAFVLVHIKTDEELREDAAEGESGP